MTTTIWQGVSHGETGIRYQGGFYYWVMPNGRYTSAKRGDWVSAGGSDDTTEIVLCDEPPREPDDHEFVALLLAQE